VNDPHNILISEGFFRAIPVVVNADKQQMSVSFTECQKPFSVSAHGSPVTRKEMQDIRAYEDSQDKDRQIITRQNT